MTPLIRGNCTLRELVILDDNNNNDPKRGFEWGDVGTS